MSTSRSITVSNWRHGKFSDSDDRIVGEVPVAITYNRISHVVMMATPENLDDFAYGFSLTEGIIHDPSDLHDVKVLPRPDGIEIALTVTEECFEKVRQQRRNLVGRTGCGLCGAETLEQALRYPAPVGSNVRVSSEALQTAARTVAECQPLQALTGAVHCAAWCNLAGEIQTIREDVGRHNALDKLIGHLSREHFHAGSGFILISSRASYEMVYKTAAAGVEVLVAVSAPTTLAVDFARQSGITLIGFIRPGRHNIYTYAERVTEHANE